MAMFLLRTWRGVSGWVGGGRGEATPAGAAEDRAWRGLEPLEPRLLLSADMPVAEALQEDELLSNEMAPAELAAQNGDSDAFTPERPVLVVPGIVGTFGAAEFAQEWFVTRGIAPELPDPDPDGDGSLKQTLEIDPLAGFYNDLMQTFINVGYELNETLFAVNYDWRLMPGPAPDLDGGDGYDGELDVGGAAGITDGVFEYAVDYMGHYLKLAAEAWESLHGEPLEAVDVVAHSTGGLVARAYIQSDAYGDTYEADKALPEINHFAMVGVPNRGASKPWNALHNNFAADPAYRLVISKIGYQAYTLLAEDNGIDVITGADHDITLNDVTVNGEPDFEAFISLYVPTLRGLLATYPFLIDGDSVDNEPRHINHDTDEDIARHRNDVLLDLNAGLDVDWFLDDASLLDADGLLDLNQADPSPFIERLYENGDQFGRAMVIYAADEDTFTLAEQREGLEGPLGFLPPLVGADQYVGSMPGLDQMWYADMYLEDNKANGDGTVAIESTRGQFAVDPRFHGEDARGVLHRMLPHADYSIDHTGIMGNPQVQRIILDQFIGADNYNADQIATGLANDPVTSLVTLLNRGVYDHLDLPALEETLPVEKLMDALGWLKKRAAGVDDSTLMNTEIPLIGKTVRELISFEDVVNAQLTQRVQDAIDDPEATLESIYDLIEVLSGAGDKLEDMVIPEIDDVTPEGVLVRMQVPVRHTTSVAIELDWHALNEQLPGMRLDADAELEVVVAAAMDVILGLDTRAGTDDDERVFIQPGELDVTAKLIVDGIAIDLALGLAEASIDGGRIELGSRFSTGWTHPADEDRFTLGEMLGEIELGLDDPTLAGSLEAELPVNVSFAGFESMGEAQIALSSDDPFDPDAYALELRDFDELLPLTRLGPAGVVSLMGHLAGALSRFNDGAAFDIDLPFANDRTLGDALDFGEALAAAVIDPLVDEDGAAQFRSFDEMAAELAALFGYDPDVLAPVYDPLAEELAFELVFDHAFDPDTVRFALDADAGALGGLSSGTVVDLLAAIEAQMTFGVGLDELSARIVAEDQGPTDGRLDEDAEFTLRIGTESPVSVTVAAGDTDTNVTFDDLIGDINDALADAGLDDRVTAENDGGRLALVTAVQGFGGASLTLEADVDDATVTELHMLPLHLGTQGRSDLLFVENAGFAGTVELDIENVSAIGRFGFIEIGVNGGSGALTANLAGELLPPGGAPGDRITFGELTNHARTSPMSVLDTGGLTGSAQLVLPISVAEALLGDAHPDDPRIMLDWSDISDPSTIELSFNDDMQDLVALRDLEFSDIIDLLSGFVDVLRDQMQAYDWLDAPIPLINQSVNDLLDLADDLAGRVADAADDPAATLDELADTLNDALGLPDDAVNLTWADEMLRVDFDLERVVSAAIDLHIDLAELAAGVPGLGGLSQLFNVSSDGKLDVTATAALSAALGVDLSDDQPRALLLDDTGIDFTLSLAAADLGAEVVVDALGGLIIAGGTASLHDGSGSPMQLRLELEDEPAGYELASLSTDALVLDVSSGNVDANLPVFFPTASNELEKPITLSITDLFTAGQVVTMDGPDLEDLVGTFDLTENLGLLLDGLDLLLRGVQTAMSSEILANNLPLVGDNLADGVTFIEDIRTGVLAELREQLEPGENAIDLAEQALFDALGPAGLGVVSTIDDIDIDVDNDEIIFDIALAASQSLLEADIDFDIGIPALGLSVEGSVDVELGFEWDLGFGISRDDGFFLLTGPQRDLEIALAATAPGLEATGSLAFLQLDVTDLGSSLGVDLTVALEHPGGLDRLPMSDFGSLGNVIDAQLSGGATAALDLWLSVGGDAAFPSLGAELLVDWTFNTGDMEGEAPTVTFDNVQLSAGEFVSDFVAPVLERIQDITEPLQPIINILTTPLPVVSDLRGQDYTLIDLAASLGNVDGTFIQAAAEIITLINSLPVIDGEVTLELGGFTVGEDVRGLSDLSSLVIADQDISEPAESPLDQFINISGDAADFIAATQTEVMTGNDGLGIQFPLLSDPLQAFGLLLGQDVDLFLYDMPSIDFAFEFSQTFGPLIPPIPLFAELRGELWGGIDLGFGYDTRGLRQFIGTEQPLDLLNGFFVSTREDPGGFGDELVSQVQFGGSITAGAVIDLAVARGGVRGGIFASLEMGLQDHDDSGRVYVDQFIALAQRGLECIFFARGAVTAELRAFGELLRGAIEIEETIASTVLWEAETDMCHCFPGRFAPNETMDTAHHLGTAPGIHVVGDSISDPNDRDWYTFTLPHEDTIDITAEFDSAAGNTLEVFDGDGNVIQRKTTQSDRVTITLNNAQPGDYLVYLHGQTNNYMLSITPGSASDTTVYYVNPEDDPDFDPAIESYYTLAPGDNANNGLSPDSPMLTVAALLDAHDVGHNDVIVLDTGVYEAFTLTDAHDGVTILGSVEGSSVHSNDGAGIHLDGASDVTLHGLLFSGSDTGVLVDSGGAGNVIENNTFTGSVGVELRGDGAANIVRDNVIGSTDGVIVSSENLQHIHDNLFEPGDTGVTVQAGAAAEIFDNEIDGGSAFMGVTGIAIDANASSDTHVYENLIHSAAVGIHNDAPDVALAENVIRDSQTGFYGHGLLGSDSAVRANVLHDNTTGVRVPGDATDAIVRYNTIHDSHTGIDLSGGGGATVIGNTVFDSQTGITGGPVIGGSDWSEANRVHDNDVGIDAAPGAEVRFNRVWGNETGIAASHDAYVHHNVVFRSAVGDDADEGDTPVGIRVTGSASSDEPAVRIEHNTVYEDEGDALQIAGTLGDLRVVNNILWSESAAAMRIDTASLHVEGDAVSDYNNLYRGATGVLVDFGGVTFGDVLDWQIETGHDAHSLGYTSVDPERDRPQFIDPAPGTDNFRIEDFATTAAAGDPAAPFDNEPAPNGGRVNIGAYGNTSLAAAADDAARLRLDSPNYYVDWFPDEQRTIRWSSDDLAGDVRIEVVDDVGNATLIGHADIADGAFDWAPSDSGLTGDNSRSYTLRLTSLEDMNLVAESRESFTVPAASDVYYVADPTTAAGDRVHATAAGDNRHHGRTADAPKATLAAILALDDLGAGNTVFIDAGEYVLVETLELGAEHEGVRLVGARAPGEGPQSRITHVPVSAAAGPAHLIEITEAAGATIERLHLLPTHSAIVVTEDGMSPNVTIRENTIEFNAGRVAIDIEVSADGLFAGNTHGLIEGNLVMLNATSSTTSDGRAIRVGGPRGWIIRGNELVGHEGQTGTGMEVLGDRALIEDNLIRDFKSGISGGSLNSRVIGNELIDNTDMGLLAIGHVLANTITGSEIGMWALGTGSHNVLHGNDIGAVVQFDQWGGFTHNEVFDNELGIRVMGDARIEHNHIYENQVGIRAAGLGTLETGARIAGNVIRHHTDYGVQIVGSSPNFFAWDAGADAVIINNTFIEPTANIALVVEGTDATRVVNNIFVVGEPGGGDGVLAIAVDSGAAGTFDADRNLFHTLGNASVGIWDQRMLANGSFTTPWLEEPSIAAWERDATVTLVDDTAFGALDGWWARITNGSLRQQVTVPDGSATLEFEYVFLAGFSQGNDLVVTLDGVELATIPGADATSEEFASMSIDIDASLLGAEDVWLEFSVDGEFGAGQYYLNDIRWAEEVIDLTPRDALGDWQAASGHDGDSRAGDPLFADPAAHDYRLAAGSPAIDHGFTQGSPRLDIGGLSRVDDVGTTNTAPGDWYEQTVHGQSMFSETGTDVEFYGSDSAFEMPLDFAFPLFGHTYDRMHVSTNGVLTFDDGSTGTESWHQPRTSLNSLTALTSRPRIAPLWQDLLVQQPFPQFNIEGGGIFVDDATDGQITVRWEAFVNDDDNEPLNFAVTLFDTGDIRFDYGEGNEGIDPRIAISAGIGGHYILADHDGAASLNEAASITFATVPGFVDLGAHEFAGEAVTPPTPTFDIEPVKTNLERPVLNGPIDPPDLNSRVLVQIGDFEPFVGNVTSDSTWQAIVPLDYPPVPDGTYDVTVNITQGLEDPVVMTFAGALALNATGPQITFEDVVTSDPTPTLTGTIDDPNADLDVWLPDAGDFGVGLHSPDGFMAPINRGDGTWAATVPMGQDLEPGEYEVQINASDGFGNFVTVTGLLTIDPDAEFTGEVVGRHTFYNNSAFDGDSSGDAIATDKQPLLPGQAAAFANYTSYTRGLNGLLIDVLDAPGLLSASDFEFHVGEPGNWSAAPAPQDLALRLSEGVGDSDRVEVVFADHAITDTWLRVTVLANGVTGLSDNDVFYFGNAVGATGHAPDSAAVTDEDLSRIRENQTGFSAADIDDVHDINRDGRVDLGDVIQARNAANTSSPLELFTAPTSGSSSPATPAPQFASEPATGLDALLQRARSHAGFDALSQTRSVDTSAPSSTASDVNASFGYHVTTLDDEDGDDPLSLPSTDTEIRVL